MPFRIIETNSGRVAEPFEYTSAPPRRVEPKKPSVQRSDRRRVVTVFHAPEVGTCENPSGRREYLPEGGFEAVMREAIAYNRANPGVYTGLELARVEDTVERAVETFDALEVSERMEMAFANYLKQESSRTPKRNGGRKPVYKDRRIGRAA